MTTMETLKRKKEVNDVKRTTFFDLDGLWRVKGR